MGRHIATTGRRRRSGRRVAERPAAAGRRLVLGGLALAAATAVLLSSQGSLAFWTDQATVSSGGFSAGTLDLTVDGAQGLATPYAKTTLALSAMVPGESVASTISVANVGDASFGWVPTATTAGGLAGALQVDLFLGGGTSGQATTYPRTQTCTGTRLTSGTTSTTLAKGAAAQTLCVQVSLPTTVGDAFQGVTTGSVKVVLAATQVLP